ncbi:MAG: rRNA maturation RNase YbeY, partial [bacterium]
VALNARFSGIEYSPNVLAFPYDAEDGDPRVHGDIAICPAIVAREALAQHKPFDAHLAHLVVHGVLHLRGYDHIEDRDAARMERLESKLVVALGFDDPWAAERPPHATIRVAISPSTA